MSINTTDRFAKLNGIQAGEISAPSIASDVQFWTHEPFKPLIGEILDFGSFEHPQYGLQETVIVEREDGERVSAILTDYLQKGFQMQNAEIGDLVLIEKQGQAKSKYGKFYNKFVLVIDKQD
jgi:hypothetical protein